MLKLLSFIIILSSFFSNELNAYIDPGTGSSFLHIVMAFFAAAGASVVFFWNKVSAYIKSIFNKK